MPDIFYPPLLFDQRSTPPRDRSQFITTDAFDSRYYSGIDIGIYFEDTYVDECTNIQYQIMEGKQPYYGYASYVPNRFAPGTRLVQGSFSINFKETFYIYKLLRHLKDRVDVGAGRLQKNPTTYKTVQQALSNDMTLEDFVALSNGNSSPDGRLRLFHEVADSMEAALWGAPSQSTLPVKRNGPLFDAGPEGFSIYLRYGEPLAQKAQQTVYNPNNPGPAPDGQPGAQKPMPQTRGYETGTLHRLVGCQITGVGQGINDSGQPVMEVYSFLASDIDEQASPDL